MIIIRIFRRYYKTFGLLFVRHGCLTKDDFQVLQGSVKTLFS